MITSISLIMLIILAAYTLIGAVWLYSNHRAGRDV